MKTPAPNRNEQLGRSQKVVRRSLLAICVACTCWSLLPSAAFAQIAASREAKIKSAYVYQFIQYVDWPAGKLAEETAPITIGAVGQGQVADILKVIAQKRNADKHDLLYEDVTTVAQAKGCHILFLRGTESEVSVKRLLNGLQNEPVLLVGEHPQFLKWGGIIRFEVVDNRVQLSLSMVNAAKHNLKVSSQLARVAVVVD